MITKDFKYVVEGSPIDFFFTALSKKQVELMYEYRKDEHCEKNFLQLLEDNHNFIEKVVKEMSNEKPHTIRYFSIPYYDYGDMEMCALAKIENNGTTYMFTNNEEFARLISGDRRLGFTVTEIK